MHNVIYLYIEIFFIDKNLKKNNFYNRLFYSHRHGLQKVFSCRGLNYAIQYFNERGHFDITVVLPQFRRHNKLADYPTMDGEILDELNENKQLIYTPNGVYDDEILLNFALKKNAVIVSNDKFRDFSKDETINKYLQDYK